MKRVNKVELKNAAVLSEGELRNIVGGGENYDLLYTGGGYTVYRGDAGRCSGFAEGYLVRCGNVDESEPAWGLDFCGNSLEDAQAYAVEICKL